MAHATVKPDGSFDFSRGVNSQALTTVQSALTPNGLPRNALSWLINATVRGGGITQMTGAQPNGRVTDGSKLYQGGILYEPIDGSTPYFLFLIGGHVIQFLPDVARVFDLTQIWMPTDPNPANQDQAFFVQAEEFVIIQAGDLVTLPLFWDGSRLRRSLGPSRNFATVPLGFTAPAIGFQVQVAFAAAYTGPNHQVIVPSDTLVGQYEIVVGNQITMHTNTDTSSSWPAGTPLKLISTGQTIALTAVPFTVPAFGVNVNVIVSPSILGPFPVDIFMPNGSTYRITAGPALPANNYYLINLTDVAGTNHPVVLPATVDLLSVPELPPARAMDYYMDRVWYDQGHTSSAGDIVKGPSGTPGPPYEKRNSILSVTENPVCVGGDGFTVPENAGNIRALFHTAELNTALGQGLLYMGTRKAVCSLQVPVTRTDWINADVNTQPQRKVVQRINGPVNDRSVVHINGDVMYQALEPSIRSLFLSVRNDAAWGNKPISRNISRAMEFTDRSLMRFASGIEFDNRMLQAILPKRLPSGQVVHEAIAPLDFDIISNLETELQGANAPAFEGVQEGLLYLQLFSGDFGGVQRAFAAIVSEIDESIQVWELTRDSRTQNGDNRVTWLIEFPAFTGGSEFELKKLRAAEIFVDKIFGTVDMTLDYRQDMNPCWSEWGRTSFCSARNTQETMQNPVTETVVYPYPYPSPGVFRENYCFPVTFGEPPAPCSPSSCTRRPGNWGYQFQPRLTITGWCRIRGILLYMENREKGLYEDLRPC